MGAADAGYHMDKAAGLGHPGPSWHKWQSPESRDVGRPLSILMAATTAYPDETGGRETYIYEMSRALTRLGHSVTLVTGAKQSEVPAEEIIGGVRFVRYPVNGSNLISLIWSRLRGLRGKIEELRESGATFDLVNYHGPWSARAVNAVQEMHDILRVYTFHSPVHREVELLLRDNPSVEGSSWKRLFRPVYLSAYKKLAHRAEHDGICQSDVVVTLSQYMKGLAMQYHRVDDRKVTVIPGGVDVDRFHPGAGRKAARQALGLPLDASTLLTVRRLTSRMGVDMLIGAMPYVVAKVPGVLLVIGGKGSLEHELRRQVGRLGLQACVRFAGYIPAEHLPEYYRAADLFVLPSVELEGFGLVTLETLACATPVAGTAVGGTSELLAGLGSGMLLSADSPHSFGEGIVGALRVNGRAPQVVAAQCREYALTYAWPIVAGMLAATYYGLLTGAGTYPATQTDCARIGKKLPGRM